LVRLFFCCSGRQLRSQIGPSRALFVRLRSGVFFFERGSGEVVDFFDEDVPGWGSGWAFVAHMDDVRRNWLEFILRKNNRQTCYMFVTCKLALGARARTARALGDRPCCSGPPPRALDFGRFWSDRVVVAGVLGKIGGVCFRGRSFRWRKFVHVREQYILLVVQRVSTALLQECVAVMFGFFRHYWSAFFWAGLFVEVPEPRVEVHDGAGTVPERLAT